MDVKIENQAQIDYTNKLVTRQLSGQEKHQEWLESKIKEYENLGE